MPSRQISGRTIVGTLLMGLFICLCLFNRSVSTTASELSWTNESPVSLEKISDLATNELPPQSISGNRDCETRKVITKPYRILPAWPFIQQEESHESCVVNSLFGAVSTSGYVQMEGTTIAGQLKNPFGGHISTITAIPRSNSAVYFNSSPNSGVYALFIPDLKNSVIANASSTGEVTYSLKQGFAPTALRDKAGNLLSIKTDSISFSPNGEWMIADAPDIGALRISIRTFEALPFDDPFNYNIGLAPGVQTAITNDGRYAIVASGSFTRFKIFDLTTCGPAPQSIKSKVVCQSRNLYPFISTNLGGFMGAGNIRFVTNYSMRFYAGYKDSANKLQRSLYVLNAPGETANRFGYLALGDSFASGEGAYEYKAVTDTAINKCHLSQKSYPYLIADQLSINMSESVACSGAIIDDLRSSSEEYEGQSRDHIKRRDRTNEQEILSSFLPGYVAQWEFTDKHKPGVVTIAAGGNDIGFDGKVKRCLAPDTCFASYEDRLEIVREINAQFPRLVDLYKDIAKSLDPRAKIYTMGYPQVAKPGGSCDVNVHLNEQEVLFSTQLISYINSVIKAASDNAGVFYVDIENAMEGHRLCETVYSNTAINGLTAGNDIVNLPLIRGPIGNESYHPNAMGHRLYKETILNKTNNFTAAMPKPNPTITHPVENNNIALLQAPKSNRSIYKTFYDYSPSPDLLIKKKLTQIVIDRANISLKPLSTLQLWLNSDPIHLGSATSDSSGNISTSITIPEQAPAGFHTLHIYGTNIAGEPVDIYKTIYVAESETDYDGDGVENATDPCLVIEPSTQDTDKDGIDDGCDGEIGDPPIIIPPVTIEEPPIFPELPPAILDPNTEPTSPLEVIEPNPELPVEVIETPTENETQPPIQDTENPQTTETPETKPPENNPQTEASNTQGRQTIEAATQPESLIAAAQVLTRGSVPIENTATTHAQTPQVAAAAITEPIKTPPISSKSTATSDNKHVWIFAVVALVPLAAITLISKLKP